MIELKELVEIVDLNNQASTGFEPITSSQLAC